MSAAASPNVRENAFFWASRTNPNPAQVAQDFMDRLVRPENESLVNEALFRMTFDEHRKVLEQIVQSSNPNKFSAIEKIYKGGSITLRTDLVGFVAKLSDPQATKFVMDVAQTDKDSTVRNAAIEALAKRRDPTDSRTYETIQKSPTVIRSTNAVPALPAK